MCAIAGILSFQTHLQWAGNPLAAMLQALRHRGPDDQGIFQSVTGNAALAHARLSILDLSPTGHQPMSTPDGRFTLVFNGEIYNFRELREGLIARGFTFRSSSDTEVILRAYEADGPACVAKLRGMFAFALWDEREGTCLLARDPFGIKPLYYHLDNGRLVFASELRALLASGLVPRHLDPQGLHGYFRTGSVPEPLTLLRGVRCLEAGHWARWRTGRLESKQYWEIRFTSDAVGTHDPVPRVRSALLDSVAHHFISDVPVGVFLSGGIDSTALVALARAAGRTDLHTYSIAFPNTPGDEGELAKRTATRFGTTHHEWKLDAAAGRQLLAGFLQVMDQPSIDGLNTFTVSKFARSLGMKVVLSGLGSDELFGGYKSFREVPRLARINRCLRWAGPLRTGLCATLGRASRGPLRRMGEMFGQPARLDTAYAALRGTFTSAEATSLTRFYAGESVIEDFTADTLTCDPTPEDGVSRLELTRYMRNQLLRDSDVMSMAHGLELRVPFLDRSLVTLLCAIPSSQRLQKGKRLLIEAVPELPDWVVNLPKRGFVFPFEQWLLGEWKDWFHEVDARTPIPLFSWYRRWSLLALENFLRSNQIECSGDAFKSSIRA